MFSWGQVWGLRWPWESRDSAKVQVTLDNTSTTGSFIVVLTDDCIPMPTAVGHNNRLIDIVTVVEPSDISLANYSPSHGDPFPNHDTFTSIAIV